jgi:hypothetical protein
VVVSTGARRGHGAAALDRAEFLASEGRKTIGAFHSQRSLIDRLRVRRPPLARRSDVDADHEHSNLRCR